MHGRRIGILGAVLLVVGLTGVATVTMSSLPDGIPYDSGQFRLSGTDTSLGARIFLDGIGEDALISRSAVGPGMMGGGCARCHGTDGRGGTFRMMMGVFEAPDVTYDALTSEHEEDGHEAHEGWDDEDIWRAITDGVEPDGERLDPFMPRWQLSDREFDALLDYLKELNDS